MSTVVLFARLGLAAVFLVAGVAKLADLDGSRRAVRAFGVPAALAGAGGTLLPMAELAVAGALVVSGSARWGGVGALVLIGGFVAAIAVALGKRRQPECHCFGQLHSRPAGWATLVRNLSLAGVALLVVVARPPLSVTRWWGSLSHAQLWVLASALACAVIAAQATLTWRLLRRHGVALLRVRELEASPVGGPPLLAIGDSAPSFDLPGLVGERVSLAGLLSAGRDVLLVFTDPRCSPCQTLLPQLAASQDTRSRSLTIALISRGPAAENLAARDEHGLPHVARQAGHETDTDYGVVGTPSAILVGAEGRIVAPLVVGADRIVALARGLASEMPAATAAAVLRPEMPAAAAVAVLSVGAAAAVTAVPVAAATPDAVTAGGERAAAVTIARELGNLIRSIAPESFTAGQALRSARIATPGASIRIPAATRSAWQRRLHDIDRAHAKITGVHGADATRRAALHAVDVLRAACRDGELALTSPTAGTRNQYAKRQQSDVAALHRAIQILTAGLHQAGATGL